MNKITAALLSLTAVLTGCGLMAVGGHADPEVNLFTVQGPVVTATVGPATATRPAERIRPPDTTRVVVMGDSTGEFLGRSMAPIQGIDLHVWAARRCPLRPDEHSGKFGPNEQTTEFHKADTGAIHEGQSCGWRNYLADMKDVLPGSMVFIYTGPLQQIEFDDGDVLTSADVMADELTELVRALYGLQALRVILVSSPMSVADYNIDGIFWKEAERVEAWRLIEAEVSELTGTCWIDYASWAATQPDPRQDGAHMSGDEGVRHALWIISEARAGSCGL